MTNLAPQKGLTKEQIAALVGDIIQQASLEEKVAMMSGHGFFKQYKAMDGLWGAEPYRAGAGCERLAVPALWFTDGPRGVARGNSTCFPVSMARGATWDRDLERRVGEVMGIEARAQGCNLSGAVCINLLRHPGWGRSQETYGEDSFHLGEMGAALAQGIQTHNVIATVKHFALNSMENARFKVDVQIGERALREVYLPHFKRVIDAGCASVMSAYNKMNGEYCGQNRELLTGILREEWGFDGFVHSDWIMGLYEPYAAAAGLDIENPEPMHFGEKLVNAVQSGSIEPSVIDTACNRILTTLYRFACAEDPLEDYSQALVACPAHIAVAREAAEKSAVLLSNNGVLPLSEQSTVAVFGKLAEVVNTGDMGSSRVRPPYVVTALDGLSARLGRPDMQLSGTEDDPDAAAKTAAKADIAIVVVGYTSQDEGEYIPGDISLGQVDLPDGVQVEPNASATAPKVEVGGDRDVLNLPTAQVALIRSVCKANNNTVVIVISGSAVVMSEWSQGAAAIMQTGYSGMEGGNALAALLFGDIAPSGKLPFSVAREASHYPFFDKNADAIEYGLLHGYTYLDEHGVTPHFAFGHGLSYVTFNYRALQARATGDSLDICVSICNRGSQVAEEVAQLYIGFPGLAVPRPKKLLRGFTRVKIQPGETQTVRFKVAYSDLYFWCKHSQDWQLEHGPYQVMVGGSSNEADSLSATVVL